MKVQLKKMYRSDGNYEGVDPAIETAIRPFQLAYRRWDVYYVCLTLDDPMRERYAHQIRQLKDGSSGVIKAMDGITWQCIWETL